jgi:3-dehydroquinate dehydratase
MKQSDSLSRRFFLHLQQYLTRAGISDIYKREEFRKFSYLSDIAEKVFCGLGIKGYELALMEAIGSSAKEK